MKTIIPILVSLMFIGSTQSLFAQDASLEKARQEVQKLTEKEQQAFSNGNCEVVLDLMSENITFYANGNPSPPREMIRKFCEKVPRPFKTPEQETLKYYPLNSETVYVVRTMEYTKNANTRIKEIVTKIWNMENGAWKIVHLHSTVKEIPLG
ncbi:hypothetical protein E7Z59_05640 [Robertkochia marina]|uniref:Calcium/calmodulin-dependent protein kinase II association-domain domain-containing protein n=1 Tax=Robertkochia marina TaxID=1227945 RepID=A0A4S3M522_9FLAO|nr:DUF4440 domain-containing protein [Robertkochia marina]THD69809.1 hypothetical protein E7Z59_05640 [Robertkochia marina]TRZ46846.1 hypothetical protein D3A96_04570 [Robertkochia marina]